MPGIANQATAPVGQSRRYIPPVQKPNLLLLRQPSRSPAMNGFAKLPKPERPHRLRICVANAWSLALRQRVIGRQNASAFVERAPRIGASNVTQTIGSGPIHVTACLLDVSYPPQRDQTLCRFSKPSTKSLRPENWIDVSNRCHYRALPTARNLAGHVVRAPPESAGLGPQLHQRCEEDQLGPGPRPPTPHTAPM